jgi:F-type H+-transporting ATPase subunit epsilon
MNILSLKIVSPEKLVFEETDFDSITFPAQDGEITVLPGHIPLISKIVPGEITARKKDKTISLVTTDGFLNVSKDGTINVLSDYAIRSEDVEIAKVQEAKRKAEAAMKEKKSERDFAIAEAELRRTLLELKVAQRRKQNIKV